MKFITEEAYTLDSDIDETVNESTGVKENNYYIHGIFSTPGQKNRNGLRYPKAIWEEEGRKYQTSIKENSINSLGEWEHPSRTNVDPLQAVMKMTEITMKDGLVYGRAKILNNNSDKTNQLKSLIDEGMKIGVSSRGVGSVKNGIVESFKLITWDAVASPSDYNSNLDGINESIAQDIGNLTFGFDEHGNIVQMNESECSGSCSLYDKEDINKAVMQKFNQILESLKNSK